MSNFIVSARKYRPARFADVVGQEHITNTLKNAIRNNHLAHSFLFTGPRGVGKTTCARILAKTINCENLGADTEACNECESCRSFNNSNSFNIHELDAASNNSVEDIRLLTDQVRFAPASGKYKIYIIDEVHMLSASAFNAFLKTLEEPPHYAIFILATTEKNKIIPTILSRCQIFDFKRIAVEGIVAQLDAICKSESISADTNAMHLIAQKADGGLRDALSMFDRLVTFAGNSLSLNDVLTNLNILDYDYYFKATEQILEGNAPGALTILDKVLRSGFEGDDFILGLADNPRNLFVLKDLKTASLLEVSGELRQRYEDQAILAPINIIVNALRICNDCDIQYKSAKNKRLLVELSVMKMCYIKEAIKVVSRPPAAEEAKKKNNPV
jgi:DNA polymerase-3 subunit gamma/tau